MNADSPIHSDMDFEPGESSLDEFKDMKDAKDYSGVQQRSQVKPNKDSVVVMAAPTSQTPAGHTHMTKDVYRKESKENCLQKRKSGEF